MRNNIPTDTKTYRFPRSFRYLSIFFVAFFSAMLGLGAALPIIEPNRLNGVLIALYFMVLGPLTVYSWYILKLLDDLIAVNDSGIWYLYRNGKEIFLSWTDIISIKSHDYLQRLVLSDYSGQRVINLEYQLENFQELRDLVREKVKCQDAHPQVKKIFVRSYYIIIVLCISTLTFTGFAVWSFRDGQVVPSMIFICFALFDMVAILMEPVKVLIDANAIRIRYMFWERLITYSSMTRVTLVNVNVRVATVKIEREGKGTIKLAAFKGGSLDLYNSIEYAKMQALKDKEIF